MGIDPHYIVGGESVEWGGYRPPLYSGGGDRAWRGVGIDPPLYSGGRECGEGWV